MCVAAILVFSILGRAHPRPADFVRMYLLYDVPAAACCSWVLSQVAKDKVEAMRAERDAFAEQLRNVESAAAADGEGAVSDLQADLNSARAAESAARAALAEELEAAARQAGAHADVSQQLRRAEVFSAARIAELSLNEASGWQGAAINLCIDIRYLRLS